MALLEHFGPTLGRLRVAMKLSQEKLAHLCGLHATFVGAVERGEKSVTLENLERLAGGLRMTPWELVRVAATGELLGAGSAGSKPSPSGAYEVGSERSRQLGFSIVAERTSAGYSAYCPDLPGCAASGGSREDVERAMREAITAQLQRLRRSGSPIPEPAGFTTVINVSV
jgi:predicted RNase H-like HicB family nuclease